MFLMMISLSAAELSSGYYYQITAHYEHKYAAFYSSNHTTGLTSVESAQLFI